MAFLYKALNVFANSNIFIQLRYAIRFPKNLDQTIQNW